MTGRLHCGEAAWRESSRRSVRRGPLALPGLLLSICLGPIGLAVSAVAVTRRPRGVAIAGLIVGTVTTLALVAGLIVLLTVTLRIRGMIASVEEMSLDVEAIAAVVEAHVEREGSPPATLSGTALSEADLTDPWGAPYRYELTPDGTNWVLTCLGADGVKGTSDDLRLDGYDHSTQAYLAHETGRMASGFGAPQHLQSTIKASIAMARLHKAVLRFQEVNGRLPDRLDEMPGLVDWMLVDPWGHPYELVRPEEGGYDIRSPGPDGRTGTLDDIGDSNGAVTIELE